MKLNRVAALVVFYFAGMLFGRRIQDWLTRRMIVNRWIRQSKVNQNERITDA